MKKNRGETEKRGGRPHPTQEEPRQSQQDLERLLDKRTAELKSTKEQLKREMAERKKTEEALRESERRFTTIFETANDIIVYVNTRGKILEVNKRLEDVLGYRQDEVKGKNFARLGLFRLKDAPQILKLFKDSVRQGRVLDTTGEGLNMMELTLKHKKGYGVVVETGTTAVREDGELKGFLSILRDVTERRCAERALRQSEEKFRQFASVISDVIYRYDPSSNSYDFLSPSFEEHTGYPVEEILSDPSGFTRRITHPDDVERVFREVEDHLNKGPGAGPSRTEYRVIPKDGGIIWVSDHKNFEFGPDGTIQRINGVISDITERKRMEEALKRSERYYRGLYEGAHDAIIIFDPEGEIVLDVNQRACDVYGFDRSEFVGMSLREISEDVPRGEKHIKLTLDKGFCHHFETVQYRKNGTVMFLEINASAVDYRGQRAILSINRDITERKRAENELRMFKTISDKAGYGVSIVDLEGNVIYNNPAYDRMHGYVPGELVGKHLSIFHPEYEMVEVNRVMEEQLMKDGSYVAEEVWHKRNDNTEFLTLMSGTLIKDENGTPLFMAATAIDITERKRAEAALRESEERFSTVFSASPIGIVITRIDDGRLVDVNPAFLDMFGRTRDEVVGFTSLELKLWTHPEERDSLIKALREQGRVQNLEMKYRRKSGDFGDLLVSAELINLAGEPHMLSLMHDISQRKRADEALRESEEKFRAIFESVPISMIMIDKDGIMVEVNQHQVDHIARGLTPRDGYIGRSLVEHPAIVNAGLSDTYRRLLKGEAFDLKDVYFPSIQRGTEGYYFNIKGVPLFKDGEVIGAVTVHDEITERKQAEEEVRKLGQYLESVIDNANVWLDVLDEKANVVIWNKAAEQISGFSRQEVIGHGKIWEWLYPDEEYRSQITTKAAAIIEKGEVVEDFETTIRCKNGETKIISWNSRNLVGADCRPTGSIALGRDVTERSKLMQQLIQSEKSAAVGTLAYGIAHEFNNILAGIMVNAELGTTTRNYEEIKGCFQTIVENSQRGSSIANSLLAVAGGRKARKELISVIDPLQSVLSFVRRELEKANVKTVEQFKPVPEIFCDPGQFSEVFLNMITNARDAMHPKGGTLTVKAVSFGDHIRIVFKDTGCGIPDQIKGRIFDPFVTTKGALGKNDIPGTGLGLFLTYGIIHSYNGRIEVESKVGKGTTFTILIPVSKNLPPKTALKLKRKPSEEISGRLNILLVDDEQVICKTLRRFLESKGHQVTTSLKAKDGLEFFKRDKFDVVLSDITIPDMDGIELIKKIRKKDPKTKIIVITGHFLKEKEEEARDAGADEVLVKPFRNALLYETMARLCAESR